MEKKDDLTNLSKRNQPDSQLEGSNLDKEELTQTKNDSQSSLCRNTSDIEQNQKDKKILHSSTSPTQIYKENIFHGQLKKLKLDSVMSCSGNLLSEKTSNQFAESNVYIEKHKICGLEFFGGEFLYTTRRRIIEFQIWDKQPFLAIKNFQESLLYYNINNENSVFKVCWSINLLQKILEKKDLTKIEKENTLYFIDHYKVSKILDGLIIPGAGRGSFDSMKHLAQNEEQKLCLILDFVNYILGVADDLAYENMKVYYRTCLSLLRKQIDDIIGNVCGDLVLGSDLEFSTHFLIQIIEKLTIKYSESCYIENDKKIIEVCSFYQDFLCKASVNEISDLPIFPRILNSLTQYVNFCYDLESNAWLNLKNQFQNFLFQDDTSLSKFLKKFIKDDELIISLSVLLHKLASNKSAITDSNQSGKSESHLIKIYGNIEIWLEENTYQISTKPYFKDIIYLIEYLLPKAKSISLKRWSNIIKSVQQSFSDHIFLDQEKSRQRQSNLMAYFGFLLVYIFPLNPTWIIESFLQKSFKQNLLSLFKQDYLKIRFLGLGFFNNLKNVMVNMPNDSGRDQFIHDSQIMQMIDLIMIESETLDQFSIQFVHGLKSFLAGMTSKVDNLSQLGLKFESIVFNNCQSGLKFDKIVSGFALGMDKIVFDRGYRKPLGSNTIDEQSFLL